MAYEWHAPKSKKRLSRGTPKHLRKYIKTTFSTLYYSTCQIICRLLSGFKGCTDISYTRFIFSKAIIMTSWTDLVNSSCCNKKTKTGTVLSQYIYIYIYISIWVKWKKRSSIKRVARHRCYLKKGWLPPLPTQTPLTLRHLIQMPFHQPARAQYWFIFTQSVLFLSYWPDIWVLSTTGIDDN